MSMWKTCSEFVSPKTVDHSSRWIYRNLPMDSVSTSAKRRPERPDTGSTARWSVGQRSIDLWNPQQPMGEQPIIFMLFWNCNELLGGDLHHFVRDKNFKFVLLHHVRKKSHGSEVPEFNLSHWRPGSLLWSLRQTLGMDGLAGDLSERMSGLQKTHQASVLQCQTPWDLLTKSLQVCDWRICTHSLWRIGYTKKTSQYISTHLISMHVDWKTKYSELYQYQLTATWITFW